MKFDKVIIGNIVLPDLNFLGEIGVNDGKIVEISKTTGVLEGQDVYHYGKDFVFPGFIDAHVHCYSNPNEGIKRASYAAAKGGITTFLDMPYDLPVPVASVEVLKKKIETINREAIVDIALWGTIPKEDGAKVIDELADAGVAGFKLSTFETDPYRFPRIADADILEAMKKTGNRDLVIAFHAENDELLTRYIKDAQAENHLEPIYHNLTRPPVTETTAVIKLLDMASWADAKLHIVHVSHAKSLDYINWFKQQGTNVTAETCYNYLLLTTEDLKEQGPKAKINPPLRQPQEVRELEAQLLDDSIDFITSDHAPWQKADKSIGDADIFKAKSGTPGLEIMIPLLFDHLVGNREVTVSHFADLLAFAPAKRFNLINKGSIETGKDADFAIIKNSEPWKVDENSFLSVSDVSPYHGQQVDNRIEATFVRGQLVYSHSTGVKEQATGRFVKPNE
ncbi:amidohydrolase family protein [uncultured Planococcus sp.]|uniref:dihydroorotase n=1 Tax=uncultured Planococcus sp. TaxID=337815 RepID=UPI0026386350|nr:amidohydrolase family protein [uncultured Planococcus sp.]